MPARSRAREEEVGDAALMASIASGDLRALGALYDRYAADVRAFLLRSGERAAIDDVTHDVFLTVVGIASRFDGRASAKPLLFGIAANQARRRRGTTRRRGERLAELAVLVRREDARTPEVVACEDEALRRFDRALGTMKPKHREVFLLVEREGLRGNEAALALGVPLGTVWTRLHFAWKHLRTVVGTNR